MLGKYRATRYIGTNAIPKLGIAVLPRGYLSRYSVSTESARYLPNTSAECLQLVSTFLLSKTVSECKKEVGLYRDDGLRESAQSHLRSI